MGRTHVATVAIAIGVLACGSEQDTDAPLAPSEAAAAVLHYSPVDLGTLGGTHTYASAINRAGQVVGASVLGNGQTHAFLWTNGVIQDLGTLGGAYSEAFGINNRGHVVGTSKTAKGATHAFLWKNGHMTDVGTIGNRSSAATDINEHDEVGASADGIPFTWQNGTRYRLQLPKNASFCAVAELNDDGKAVGQCTVGQFARAFLWDGAKVKNLGTLGGSLASPSGINKAGAVVGQSWPSGGGIHPFIWEQGKMTDLITHGAPAGLAPAAINNAGWIVGSMGNGTQIVTLVLRNGTITEIDTPGNDTYSSDINLTGDVVGYTVGGDGYHAVLWRKQ